jgi:DNA segregation ATPase FtsK/SpoIIIE-like protein
MELDKKYKIEEVVDEDHSSEMVRYVHISKNRIIASDGAMLASVPCATAKGDHLGPVTVGAMAYARGHDGDCLVLHLIDGKTAVAFDSSQMARSLESTATAKGEQLDMFRRDTDKVPQLSKIGEEMIPPQRFEDILLRINPKRLLTLAKALGSNEAVTLRLTPGENGRVLDAIRVEADKDAYGVIMPMRVDNDDAPTFTVAADAADEDLIDQAIAIIHETQRASVSSIQRRLRIGYTRAAKIMDVLEARGIVGPVRGSDPREILK